MAARFGGVDTAPWISLGWLLFAASGVIWVAILLPVQICQSRLAKRFQAGGSIPKRYWSLSKIWTLFGTIAILLPLANLYFMVFKPT